ncbi:ABC transporter ATP-binding protein [Amycolatopsis sp. NPDC059657]|uniref:ABC transporter ATP-binding protein n=1 Tax=Amycolatopsis sp. NPDC059657 TaxID=3346899 RepID=UPI00366ED96F
MSTLPALVRPIRVRLTAGICCQAAAAAAGITPFIAVAELSRRLLSGVPMSALGPFAVIALLALPVRVALLVAATTLTHLADNDLQLSLRRRLAKHLARLPLGWFATHDSGRVKRAVSDDVGALHHLVAHSLLDLVSAVVVPMVSAVYLATLHPLLALVTLLPLGAGLLLHHRAMAGVAARMREYQEATASLDATVVEFVQGITAVKMFGRTGRAHHRFREAAARYGEFVAGWAHSVTPAMAWSQFILSPLVTLFAVLAAGTLIAPDELISFAVLGAGLAAPLLTIGYSVQDLRVGRTAAADICALLATPELPDHGTSTVDTSAGALVEFEAVRFSYDGVTDVLDGIDLVLAPSTITALVGPSGSGKSTLATLLARFHDVTAGAIRLNGVDLREIPTSALYSQIGFVLQDVRLSRASVAENIRMGRPDATMTEVHDAARAARIHDRVLALPQGYETVVGEDVTLSGGEAQRVSIARALLADAPVLILDEATASVDPESEAAIQDALSGLVVGRTTLVIAHRLSTVVGVDQIVVLDNGMVAERGTHDELLAAHGRYARTWEQAA